MTDCPFLPVFYETHTSKKRQTPPPEYADFEHVEEIWLSMMGLGKHEAYVFMYAECRDIDHLKTWMTELKGHDFIEVATVKFNTWQEASTTNNSPAVANTILSPEQLQFWQEQGYLKVSDVVEDDLCDAVKNLICVHLDIDLADPSTWYNPHPDRQGLMVQVYQEDRLEVIRNHPGVRQLFAELYGTTNLVANTEKLSFNPPETATWQFDKKALHWDIDLERPLEYYIQGLIYLDEVPENRGPLTLVPGFHLQFEEWVKPFKTLEDAHTAMRKTVQAQPVGGKKGDIILWRHTLPHAASANCSTLPRFVQYLSFLKM